MKRSYDHNNPKSLPDIITRMSGLSRKYEGFIEILIVDILILVSLLLSQNSFLKYIAAQLWLGFIPGSLCLYSLRTRIGRLQYYVIALVSGLFLSLFLNSIFYQLDIRFMFSVYIAITIALYNILAAFRAKRTQKANLHFCPLGLIGNRSLFSL